jgi:hypothetical protein
MFPNTRRRALPSRARAPPSTLHPQPSAESVKLRTPVRRCASNSHGTLYRWTKKVTRSGMRTLLGARRIPGPKPTEEHNRCELKPGTPRASGKALFMVCPLTRLPLYVVCALGCRISHGKTGSRLGDPLDRVNGEDGMIASRSRWSRASSAQKRPDNRHFGTLRDGPSIRTSLCSVPHYQSRPPVSGVWQKLAGEPWEQTPSSAPSAKCLD